ALREPARRARPGGSGARPGYRRTRPPLDRGPRRVRPELLEGFDLLRVQTQLGLMTKGDTGIGRHPTVMHIPAPLRLSVLARTLLARHGGGLGEHRAGVRARGE